MKLLIVTQVIDVNHPILGFFHRWIEEFAKNCEQVHVIALQVGKHSLPENVTVHSLGKDEGKGKFAYLFRFYSLIWSLRNEYDNVFVHMNQIYVILGAPFWHATGKSIGLWYVHKAVSLSLWVAEKLVHIIFTSTKGSLNVPSKKVRYVGHGIDTERWYLSKPVSRNTLHLVYLGRITPIKRIDQMIYFFKQVLSIEKKATLTIVGNPVTEADYKYEKKIKKQLTGDIVQLINWHGSIPQSEIPALLSTKHIHLNLSPNGGVDKSVLEAMSMGIPSIVTNQSFTEIFPEVFTGLTLKDDRIESARSCLKVASQWTSELEKKMDLRNLVIKRASLPSMITKIITSIS